MQRYLLKALLIVLSVLLLGSIACGRKDPKDAAIERLNAREDQLVAVLLQQNADLKKENTDLEQHQQQLADSISAVSTVAGEHLISHLEKENDEDRAALLKLVTNPPQLQVAGALIGQNQKLQDSLVKLVNSQQNQSTKLLDSWASHFGSPFSRPAPDCDPPTDLSRYADWGWPKNPSQTYHWVNGLIIGDF